jgi:hypothetical protein
MARTIARCLIGVASFALFGACGGVNDPGLFSPGSSAGAAGSADQGGATAAGGAAAHGGAPAHGGANGSAGGAVVAGGTSEAGADNGGSTAAGAANAGSGGTAQAGAAGASAGSSNGGSAGATGGAANGGSAGSFGAAGAGGSGGNLTCNELFAQASKQLQAAQACSLAADSVQCTGKVQNPCNCQVPVQRSDSAETKAYQETLKQLDKQHCVQVCSAIACLPVAFATCKPQSVGSTVGMCVASHALPL